MGGGAGTPAFVTQPPRRLEFGRTIKRDGPLAARGVWHPVTVTSGTSPSANVARADLAELLREHVYFLETSAAAFDDGHPHEAKRMAVHLRTLLHDTAKSKSLLGQLRIKELLPWADTAIYPDPTWADDYALGLCRLAGEGVGPALKWRNAAPLDDTGPDRAHPPAAFCDWWNDPVLADKEGHTFSRCQFVGYLANKDGGAHVDPKLAPAYEALSRHNSMWVRQLQGGGMAFGGGRLETPWSSPPDIHLGLASIRQITHEVLVTLRDHAEYPDDQTVQVANPICTASIHKPPSAERNHLCPCGSGRKFKHCFLMRGRRRPRATESLAITMR